MINSSNSDDWFSHLLTIILLAFLLPACQNGNQQEKADDNTDTTKSKVKQFLDSVEESQAAKREKSHTPTKKANQRPDSNTLVIGYVNWTEGIAMTHLVKTILEEEMDYTVKKRLGRVGQVLDSLAIGTNDIFLDHWLASDSVMGEMKEFVDLGINFKGAKMGLVVPDYMDINSIEELNEIKDKTKGKIVGIDGGADIMQKTEKAIEDYELDYELLVSSGPAMTSRLKQAIENEQPVVVTGWSPHWKFSRFDLKILDDPQFVYGTSKNIHTLARKGFQADYPDVANFLKHFEMNQEQLGGLIETFAASDDWDKATQKWISENQELVNEWLKEEASAS